MMGNYLDTDWCERCRNRRTIIKPSEAGLLNPKGEVTCPDCCEHDEHDHGICLECHADIYNDLVAAAEFRSDCLENR